MRVAIRPWLIALLTLAVCLAAALPAGAQTRTHIVRPGETLFNIAQRYGVSVAALQAANSLTSDRIYANQTLIIPEPGAPIAPPASGASLVHIVQPGETLFRIGLKYNVPWPRIQAANNLVGVTVYAGQRLTIPASGAPAPAPAATQPAPAPAEPAPEATPAPAGENRIHIVQRGETLFTIGLKYNLRWTAIQAANNLASDRIFAGQQLIIPAPGSVVAAPAPAAQPAPAAPSGSGKRFLVDLSDQMLYAYEGDTLVRSVLISSGRWPWPTVTGTFYVYLRYTSARMRGPGYDLANVPYVMYFYKGYGLHGTYWHNNFGTPMSHGCVNMPTPEAEWAFHWSDYGTPVIVQQ